MALWGHPEVLEKLRASQVVSAAPASQGKLTRDAHAKVHGISIGNHDYWKNGSHRKNGPPDSAQDSDNFRHGLMQWYAQDAMSAKAVPTQPFDFSAEPEKHGVAHHSNFFWYFQGG